MQPLEEDGSQRTLVWFLLGIVALGCGLLFALAFLYFRPDAQTLVDQYFPSATPTGTSTPKPTPTITPSPTLTPTATMTPTPHVLITPAQSQTVFNETFASNDGKWYGYYNGSKVAVKDGRLTLRSDERGYIAIALCTNCPGLNDEFYFQAEVSTAADTPEFYGLAFCSAGYGDDYYVFQVGPRYKQYELHKHSATGWETLIDSQYAPSLNDFPLSNTLGLYFEHGQMELYINNTNVISYQDTKPLTCRKAGLYVNDGGFDMVVDNIFAYTIQQ